MFTSIAPPKKKKTSKKQMSVLAMKAIKHLERKNDNVVGRSALFLVSRTWQPTDDTGSSMPTPALLVLHNVGCIARDTEEVCQLLHAQAGDVLVFLFVKSFFD